MKTLLRLFALTLFTAALAQAQTQIPNTLVYAFQPVTSATPLTVLQFSNQAYRPSNYTIDVSAFGTAPTACTFRVEGSNDNSVWYGLDTTAPATTSCTASFMEHIVSKPVLFLRINIVSYTAGDGTTSLIFHYVGKQ